MKSDHPALPRRLAAMLYDTFLVLPLIMAAVFAAFGARGLFVDSEEALNPILVQTLALLTCFAFFASFWLKNGQTLGMQAWRIKLVQFDGNRATFWQTLVRFLGALLSAALLGAGYWWCLIDKNRRYLHDHLSGTELILLPKQNK